MTYAILFGRFSVLDSPSKFPFRFSKWKTAGARECVCVSLSVFGWLIQFSVDIFLYERMRKTKRLVTFFFYCFLHLNSVVGEIEWKPFGYLLL